MDCQNHSWVRRPPRSHYYCPHSLQPCQYVPYVGRTAGTYRGDGPKIYILWGLQCTSFKLAFLKLIKNFRDIVVYPKLHGFEDYFLHQTHNKSFVNIEKNSIYNTPLPTLWPKKWYTGKKELFLSKSSKFEEVCSLPTIFEKFCCSAVSRDS